MKLPRVAQQNLCTPAKRPYYAANPNVLLLILAQITHSFPVLIRAHHRKPALLISGLRTANIQKSRSISQFHHVVNMGRYADVLVLMRQSIFWRVAWFFAKQHHWV